MPSKIKNINKFFPLIVLVTLFFGIGYLHQRELSQTKEPIIITTPVEYSNQHPTAENLNPVQTAEVFYNWYLNYNGDALNTDSFFESQFISNRLKEVISTQLQTQSSFPIDPFTLTETLPDSFTIRDLKIEEQLATLEISFYFNDVEFLREINLILADERWQIDQVQVIEDDSTFANNDDLMEVKIFFNDNNKYPEDEGYQCEQVFEFDRFIPTTTNLETKIEFILNELFIGPTTEEKERGASSPFSESTTNLLHKVKIIDTTAYLDFNNATELLVGNNSSCGGGALMAQIENTVKQNSEINKVIISSNGNAEDFYFWLQLGCEEDNNFCQTIFSQP